MCCSCSIALQHHWLLPINCHFLRLHSAAGRGIAAVSSAIEQSDLCLYLSSACLSVCLSACVYKKSHVQILPNFLYNLTTGGSVLLRRQCDTLCTSGFLGEVLFSYNGENRPESKRRHVCFVQYVRRQQAYFPSFTLHSAHTTHTPINSPPLSGLAHWTDSKGLSAAVPSRLYPCPQKTNE